MIFRIFFMYKNWGLRGVQNLGNMRKYEVNILKYEVNN